MTSATRAAEAASWRIELFGKFRITRGDAAVTTVNTNRLKSLLAFLILNGDAPQSREHAAFLLWPDSEEAQARTNLRQLIHHLRRALPDECGFLAAETQSVQWRQGASCTVDVMEFDAALAAAEEAGRAERMTLETAARLYQDDLLPGLYDERLVALDPLREAHHQSVIRLHAAHGDRASALRAYHQCMRTLRRELGVE